MQSRSPDAWQEPSYLSRYSCLSVCRSRKLEETGVPRRHLGILSHQAEHLPHLWTLWRPLGKQVLAFMWGAPQVREAAEQA